MNDTTTTPVEALVLRRRFAAPAARVYAAWTQPHIISQWLAPFDVEVLDARIDARVGGTYRVTMRKPDGEVLHVGGVFREMREPERLVLTWRWEEDTPELEVETLLELDFHSLGEITEMVLTHTNFADRGARDRHAHGWPGSFDKLAAVL